MKGVSNDCNCSHNGLSSPEQLEHYRKQHLKDVREQIHDIAYNNQTRYEYFFTATFDNNELGGSYSHDKAFKEFSKWLHLQKKLNPNMIYLFVYELHPHSKTPGGRVHFHGLVGNVPKWQFSKAYYPFNYKIKDKRNEPIIINDKQIYNLDNYKLGYSTLSFIESGEKASSYIAKYISKDIFENSLKHKRRFWYSQNSDMPRKYYELVNDNIFYLAKEFDITFIKEIEKDNSKIRIANFQL